MRKRIEGSGVRDKVREGYKSKGEGGRKNEGRSEGLQFRRRRERFKLRRCMKR